MAKQSNIKSGQAKYYNRTRRMHGCGSYCRCPIEVQVQGIAIWLDHPESGRTFSAYEWFPEPHLNSPTHRAKYIKDMSDLAQIKGSVINLAVEKAKERQRRLIRAKIAEGR